MRHNSSTPTPGSRACLRHEVAMLRLTATALRGGEADEAHRHTALLREVRHCPRCRRHRGETATGRSHDTRGVA